MRIRWKGVYQPKEGCIKSPSSQLFWIVETQWLSGLYHVDFISLYSPYYPCGRCGTRRNRIPNELPISVPLSLYLIKVVNRLEI